MSRSLSNSMTFLLGFLLNAVNAGQLFRNSRRQLFLLFLGKTFRAVDVAVPQQTIAAPGELR